jgi:predicted dehydrogenase
MLYLMDEVVEVSAFTDAIEYQVPVDESSTVMMRFENGAQGVAMIHWNNPYGSDQLEIGGTDGRILADLAKGHIQIWNADKQQEWTLPNPKVTHQGLVENLVEAVSENKTNCCSGSEGRKTNAVLAAAGLSNQERRVVRLDELD